jgi:GMP synthase-like glutamine amidotransferase
MTMRGERRALVFQHLAVEHPGLLGDRLNAAGFTLQTVELDEGDAIPELGQFELLLVLGGPMDVWEHDKYPWLTAEKEAIHRWVVTLGKPFLGVCLGHQLLAESTGGTVHPMDVAEIGVMDFALTTAGLDDPVFSVLPTPLRGLQWHGAEVRRMPDAGVVLADNSYGRAQAIRVGAVAWGVQFHVEVSAGTVAEWATIPAYSQALVRNGHTMEQLAASVEEHLDTMADTTERLARGLVDAVTAHTAALPR